METDDANRSYNVYHENCKMELVAGLNLFERFSMRRRVYHWKSPE
ncbi:hypothetical protein J2W55_003991 [Mucilaginibacter pocheonensis]|uniref:Transposase n=1 Tax=Mucilaginibacter pocheonensis TaxID=398050 RepID=A0ABU1TH63_9SPHI|nr:hypothetical protein [Mucilaginibacter pocheonensis]